MRSFVGLVVLACGCGAASHGGVFIAPAVAPVPSTVAATTSAGSTSSTTSAGTTTTAVTTPATVAPPTTQQLALAHAPLYRFNAFDPGGPSSIANVSEDFFPMSVKSYFDQLEAGSARVAITEACGTTPGTNALRPCGPVVVSHDAIHGVPQRMSGDDPGTAPVYFHAYEDVAKKVRNPDGSGEDVYDVEYWLFYGVDMSRDEIAGIPYVLDVGGHLGDWETVSVAVAVVLGPGGVYLRDEVRLGIYSAHGKQASVQPFEMELTDDAGTPTPLGAHPVAYVAVGKHASYPEPGYWIDPYHLLPVAIHDEWFLGNGFAWCSWRSPLLDLDGPATAEFTPASLVALEDSSVQGLTDWRKYKGTYGDTQPPAGWIASLGFWGDSPPGPEVHGNYNSMAHGAKAWHDIKTGAKGLVLGPVTTVSPAPIPVHIP
ncbi:MAG TPA: hypothetical protein VFF73_23360 [Planctomycetota bacterium]|nr:hypothetical protein [Planctomycetota bacterium]